MKAAVLHAPKRIHIEEVEKPKVGSSDILIMVKATAICGTDVDTYQGKYNVRYPLIMGHEASGEVKEFGDDVETFKLGDKVVVNPIYYCDKCYLCIKGKTNLCVNGGLLGRDIGNGSYAEYMAIPENLVFKFPPSVSFEEATLIELLATIYHAQKRVRISPSDGVAILGQGAAGLLHAKLARLSGAAPVITTTTHSSKLDLSMRYGADVCINSKSEDSIKRILDLTNGHGADVVIDAVGLPHTLKLALKAVRPGGTLLQFGIHTRPIRSLNFMSLYFKEVEIVGTRAAVAADFSSSIRLVANGMVDLEPLISHRFPLEKLEAGFQLLKKPPDGFIKGIVKP